VKNRNEIFEIKVKVSVFIWAVIVIT